MLTAGHCPLTTICKKRCIMKEFLLCFVPLFVAVDAVGVLPLFISLTEGIKKEKVNKIIIQSTVTAVVVALAFLGLGKIVLNMLGITVADFMIAGGSLLFAISLRDMMAMEKKKPVVDPESVGAVPIGVPLIVGPAVLTTMILLVDQHGLKTTVSAVILNILLTAVIFVFSGSIYKLLGKAGSKTVSKLASLILAAIGVMMARKGIMIFIGH
jgi:multiple antibiotic resistance protein